MIERHIDTEGNLVTTAVVCRTFKTPFAFRFAFNREEHMMSIETSKMSPKQSTIEMKSKCSTRLNKFIEISENTKYCRDGQNPSSKTDIVKVSSIKFNKTQIKPPLVKASMVFYKMTSNAFKATFEKIVDRHKYT